MARPRNQTNYPEYHPDSGKRILTPPEPPVQVSEFMTSKGKNVNILKDPFGYGMFVVKFHEGGSIPECLSGMFTNHEEASKAIDKWLKSTGKEVQAA